MNVRLNSVQIALGGSASQRRNAAGTWFVAGAATAEGGAGTAMLAAPESAHVARVCARADVGRAASPDTGAPAQPAKIRTATHRKDEIAYPAGVARGVN